ncbi:MAG: zinc ribbon domain-containing protein [Gemmatimonadota bacterium]
MTRSPTYCSACGAPLTPSARFCSGCGAAATPTAPARTARQAPVTAWAIAGAAVLALVIAIVVLARSGSAAPPAGPFVATPDATPAGIPPDISNMSPRERFDRLYERSMRASESGDTVTVARFAPMALLAYQQLDTIDADARYHAALLRLHTGDIAGASALGDSIATMSPGHLFGYIVQATVARWQHDDKAMNAAYTAFANHYDAEMAAARPEYAAHTMIMDDMRQRAQATKAAVGAGARN